MARHKVDITGIKTTSLKVLKNEETIDLLTEYKRNNDSLILEKIIMGNMKLILSVIKNFSSRCDNQDDLFQIGCIGLIKAINNFDESFGVRFSTYAVPMIIGEIKRYLRDDGIIKISRSIKSLSYKIAFFVSEYKTKNNKSPQIFEIANALSVDPQEVAIALDAGKTHVSLYDKGDDEQNVSVIEKLSAKDDSEEILDKIIIKDAINSLNEREKRIIILRYYKDKTQSEVAKELNVSQVQISRLESKIIDKIKTSFD